MRVEGTLEKVIITIDGKDRILKPYGEAWVQDGPKPLLHPVVAAIIWVLLQGVTSGKIPSSVEEILHRVLTALQLGFSYSYNMPEERLQAIMDGLLAENQEAKGSTS